MVNIAFSADGSRVAAASAFALGGESEIGSGVLGVGIIGEYSTTIWDLGKPEGLRLLEGHTGNITSVSFGADGTLLAIGSLDGSVHVWNVATGEELADLTHSAQVRSVSLSADGSSLAVASGGDLVVWDLASGAPPVEFLGHEATVMSVEFLPDDNRLLTSSLDGTVRIWDLATANSVGLLRHPSAVRVAVADAAGQLIATGAEDGRVRLWDVATGSQVLSFAGHTTPVSTLSFNSDGSLLASSTGIDSILAAGVSQLYVAETRVWDVGITYRQQPLTVPARDSATVAAELGRARLGSSRTFFPPSVVTRLADVAVSPDGAQMAVSGPAGRVTLWETSSGRQLSILDGHALHVTGIDYNPSGTRLATVAADGVRVWDTTDGSLLVFLVENDQPTSVISGRYIDAEFSPNGQLLAVSRANKDLTLVDSETGDLIDATTLNGSPTKVVFSPDGSTVATGSDRAAALLVTVSGGVSALLHKSQVYNLAYSPDGNTMATVSSDGKATMWDTKSESVVYSIAAERLAFRAVAFSPSGDSFATGDDDGKIRIWDAADGSAQLTLKAHEGPVLELAYGPDDTRLASISTDGTAKYNILDLDEMIVIAESKLTRSFTEAECRQYLHQDTCASE